MAEDEVIVIKEGVCRLIHLRGWGVGVKAGELVTSVGMTILGGCPIFFLLV